jgi:type I restriction enzyme S subunit
VNEGIKFIKIECFDGDKINSEKCLFIDEKTHNKELKRSILQENDLLFAIAGATIGKVNFVRKEILPANTNQALAIVRLKKQENRNYIYQILKSNRMLKYITDSISVGAQPNLNLEQMNNFSFFYPTLPEQKRIASFFTALDKKITELKQKKNLLEQYKKGVMKKLFSQDLRFKDVNGKEFPKCEKKKLSEICDYKNGGAFENQLSEDGKYYLISLNSLDITGKLKQEHKRLNFTDNSLQKGDLVMVLSDVAHGNFLGLTDIIPNDNFVLNQRMGALKPKIEVDRFYLKTFINNNQKYFKLKGQGSSQQNLSKGDIENFDINLPCLEEQTKIANFLSAIDEKINRTENQIQQTQQYKKGLLQKMFV